MPIRHAVAIVAMLSIGACQPAPTGTPAPTAASTPGATLPPSPVATAATSPLANLSPSPGSSAAAVAIDPANFTTTIDNPWFPLIPGTVFTYQGTEDGDALLETFTVTADTKVLDGVTCVVISDNLKVNGVLEERTSDYYVQDLQGNVWYFGEDTAELDEHGTVTNTDGTWHAGVDGALPGIFMPAEPTVGYSGRQEIDPGTADDRFVVILTDATAKVPFGSFSGALVTVEWTVLEPSVLSEKIYARGVGQVKEFDVRGGTESLQLTKLVKP